MNKEGFLKRLGKVLGRLTSYLILILLVGGSFFIFYYGPHKIGPLFTLSDKIFLALMPLAVFIFVFGGFILSLKIALHLIGVSLSKDVEAMPTQAAQSIAKTTHEQRANFLIGTLEHMGKRILALLIILALLFILTFFLNRNNI